MDFLNLKNFAIFALLGSVAAGWSQVRGILSKFFSFFIRTDSIKSYRARFFFFHYLLRNSKLVRWGNRTYRQEHRYVKKLKETIQIIYAVQNSIILLYRGFIPLIITPDGPEDFKITYLFGSFNLKKHFEAAHDEDLKKIQAEIEHKSKTANYFYISEVAGAETVTSFVEKTSSKNAGDSPLPTSSWTLLDDFLFLNGENDIVGFTEKDLGYEEVKKPIEDYYWSKDSIRFRKEVEYWLKSKQWFVDRGINHRRGALLYGKAGCGKTKLVVETAKWLGIPVRKVNISNMNNSEFTDAYGSAQAPSIVLIEDIDVVFNGRENRLSKGGGLGKSLLSFDTLINVLGGAKTYSGIFTVVTTNNIETLDPALVRPGRLDVKIELGTLDEAGRYFIAKNLLRDWPECIDEIVQSKEGSTAAEFENFCIEEALRRFWDKK